MGRRRRLAGHESTTSRGEPPRSAPPTATARALPTDPLPRVLWAMVIAYTVVYAALDAILLHYYLYTDFDLALFSQAVDGLLHGRLYSSIRGMAWPGDHSSLILFLLAPLYAVARHPLTLLVVQAAAQALGALPVFALARREIGHGGLALTCAGIYLLQPALGYSNLFEFHPELLATAPLLAAFYYVRSGRAGPALLWAGVALLCREDVALVVFTMALYALALRRPGGGRLALALAAAAALSVFVTWGVLRPAFNQGEAEYARVYARWGDTVGAAAMHMLRDPVGVAINLVSTPGVPRDTLVKQQFHLTLFLPLGLLPLLSPLTLALALPVFMEHLLSWRTSQHTILCQYTALQIPFVAAAAVIGLRNLLQLLARAGSPETPRTHAAGSTRPAPPVAARTASVLMLWALASSLGCQLWFGPLLSSGKFFITGTRGRHLPTPEERTLTAYRDRMVARVPRRGAVVASFEFLGRFTARDSVQSLHHLVSGTYTFSSRPYPPPEGVSALIADMGATNIVGGVVPTTAERLVSLVRRNRLVPVAEAGDLVLWVRDAGDPVDLVTRGSCDVSGREPITFDGQIEFLGGALGDTAARAGGTVTVRTCWRRRAAIDRFFETEFDLVDAAGRSAFAHRRDLGYLVWPPHVWELNEPMRESYRLILNDDLRAGDYDLMMRVRWRYGRASGASQAGDPSRYSAERGLALGRVRVRPR